MTTSGGYFFQSPYAKHNTLRQLHAMGSLFDHKLSQWGNKFLLITEACLKPSQNLQWNSFAKIVNG